MLLSWEVAMGGGFGALQQPQAWGSFLAAPVSPIPVQMWVLLWVIGSSGWIYSPLPISMPCCSMLAFEEWFKAIPLTKGLDGESFHPD